MDGFTNDHMEEQYKLVVFYLLTILSYVILLLSTDYRLLDTLFA